MAADKTPAFQFYPKDFLADGNVAGMSLEERGAYITLLCLCWQEGSLPMDVTRLAHMVGTTPRVFARVWPAVQRCFTEHEGQLRHGRLEKERAKQATYRRRQSDAGKASAAARVNHGSTAVQPSPQPKPKSPISDLQSPISSTVPSEPLARGSKRPIFCGQRFTVFEWQLEQLAKLLGSNLDAFDVHTWFYDLDEQARRSEAVIPQRDNGAWLLAQTLAEAQRRGLRLAVSSMSRRLIETTPEEDGAAVLALLQQERNR